MLSGHLHHDYDESLVHFYRFFWSDVQRFSRFHPNRHHVYHSSPILIFINLSFEGRRLQHSQEYIFVIFLFRFQHRVYFGDSDGFSVLWLLPILPHFPSLEDIEGSEVELLSVWNICLTRITSYTRRSRMIT